MLLVVAALRFYGFIRLWFAEKFKRKRVGSWGRKKPLDQIEDMLCRSWASFFLFVFYVDFNISD